MRYTRAIRLAAVAASGLLLFGCGQEEVEFPEAAIAVGTCGAWYPGGGADTEADAGGEVEYAVEKGAVFPCAVWESARLGEQDYYVNAASVYLDAKHGLTDTRSFVIIVSAKNCPNCIILINAIADRAAEFEEAGAYMLVMARRDQFDAAGPDLTLEQAYDVAVDDGWPVESWPVINGEEHYIDETFDDIAPWTMVVGVKDMRVRVADTTSFVGAEGASELLEYLSGPEFD